MQEPKSAQIEQREHHASAESTFGEFERTTVFSFRKNLISTHFVPHGAVSISTNERTRG